MVEPHSSNVKSDYNKFFGCLNIQEIYGSFPPCKKKNKNSITDYFLELQKPFHENSLANLQINRINWAASSEFGIYRLCEQRRFRRACASAQSRQNLRCSLKQAVSQEEPSDRKSDPWPL